MPEKIIAYGHPILRETCTDVDNIDQARSIRDKLLDTTFISRTMLGLAAPQIGITKRAFIMRMGTGFKIIINPLLTKKRWTQRFEEGCMSIPDVFQLTDIRADIIDVTYRDENMAFKSARFRGKDSVVFQHEMDHLNGILFVDHLSAIGREAIADKLSDIEHGIIKNCNYALTFKKLSENG